MSSFKLPRAVSWPLTIQRGEAQLSAALAIVFDDQSLVLNELAGELLGPTEFAYFSTLPFGRRRQGYLLGRYAAKLALRDLLQESDLRIIEIVRGVFDQPIVLFGQKQGWSVTISHADSLAFALAFPTGHPMGIDAERIDSTCAAMCEAMGSWGAIAPTRDVASGQPVRPVRHPVPGKAVRSRKPSPAERVKNVESCLRCWKLVLRRRTRCSVACRVPRASALPLPVALLMR